MNPFKYGQVVRDADFCKRPQLLGQLKLFIESGQNVLLQGERRIGKTSLILEACRMNQKKRFIYVDLLEVKSLEGICKRIARAIISLESKAGFMEKALKLFSNLKPSFSLDPFSGQPSLSFDSSVKLKPKSLEELLDLLEREYSQKGLVVVWDEFQDILQIDRADETLAVLRGKIQFHSDITYIFSGSIRNTMYDIFHSSDSPLFKSAALMEVETLEKNDFTLFLRGKFSKGKRAVSNELLEHIFCMVLEIPGDVQEFCSAIWDTTCLGDNIDIEIIPKALELIHARESKSYDLILRQLTDLQMRCLSGLAKFGGRTPTSTYFLKNTGIIQPSSVSRALKKLISIRVIYHYGNEYRFVNSFLSLWLKNKDF